MERENDDGPVKEAEERADWWKESQDDAGFLRDGRTVSGLMRSSV